MSQMKNPPFAMPSFDLSGKVAIVTGGTKGLGHAIAMTYAYYGAKLVVASRHQEDCDSVAAEIKEMGGEAIGIRTDVQSPDELRALVDGSLEAFGALDILVNNAGVAVTKSILDTDETEYDRVLQSNLRSVYFGSQAAARAMKERGSGRIINMASIGGLNGNYCLSTYGASKAAIVNLTKSMAVEWGKFGILVNAICPGYVRTDLNAENLDDPAFREKTLKRIPLRRFGETREVAAVALFLASDASSIMTGSVLVADMGATCCN
jgi:NAD(P)-dependent dehydrogenase (short-subunit alcohol dehydrogenase family)